MSPETAHARFELAVTISRLTRETTLDSPKRNLYITPRRYVDLVLMVAQVDPTWAANGPDHLMERCRTQLTVTAAHVPQRALEAMGGFRLSPPLERPRNTP